MTQTYDLTGNTVKVDNVNFSAENTLATSGTKAGTPSAFDKVLQIEVDGVDYWIGLYSDNT